MRTPKPWPLPERPMTRRQLLRPGVSAEMLATQVRAGRLLRLRPGVYLDARCWPAEPREQYLVLAHAEQAACPDAVLSHATAAETWRLPSPAGRPWHEQGGPVLTLPSGAGYRSDHRSARLVTAVLPEHHLARDGDGYLVTNPARTAVDLARGLALPDCLVLLDAAARKVCESVVAGPRRADYANPRLAALSRTVIAEVVDTLRFGSLRGAIGLADARRESPIESLTAAHLHLAGLPTPAFQHPIPTPAGLFFVDCYWEESALIGEADGAVKYAVRDAYVDEKAREQVLRDLGYRMVRWLGREIMFTPGVVMDRIERALRAAA